MRRLVLILMLLTLAIHGRAAQPEPPRLIVRGDDMGYSHSGNEAILKCSEQGIQTSIEVIVPSPWFPEAARMLERIPRTDVGVHLALTSEWDNIKWRPVTDSPTLRDADGYFFPMIRPHRAYPGRALAENRWELKEIEREFRAQIELARKRILRISHVTGHMGCSGFDPQVAALTRRLTKEYAIDINPAELGVSGVTYIGPRETSEEKIAGFVRMLESLQAGKSYLFVDHPGLDGPELRAIHHVGYENVAVDRQGVTDTWTSPRVKDAIKRLGIRLISYADLRK